MSVPARVRRGGRRPRERRGAVLVLVAVLMVPLLALAAFSLDVGWWQVGANQLQTTADAAALAGARALQLDSTPDPQPRAFTLASQIASANKAFSQTVTLAGGDVAPRFWNMFTLTLDSVGVGWSAANAVQVTARSTPGLILAGIALDSAPTISRRATAWIANITEMNCVKPWALPYAALYGLVTLSPPSEDTLSREQLAAFTTRGSSAAARTLVLSGPNATPLPDGSWRGHLFGGGASESAVYAAVQGCDPTVVTAGGSQGNAVGSADYGCWVVRALAGLGPGGVCPDTWPQAAPCHFKSATDAGCYASAGAIAPGVRLRMAWTDGGGTHRMVATADLVCAYKGVAGESCPLAANDLPLGTLVVTVHGITPLRLEPTMDFSERPSLNQRLFLVR